MNRTIILLGITVFTMVVWIGVEVFLAQKKEIVRPIAEKAAPFSTDIKADVLKKLQERPTFEEYTPSTTPVTNPTPTPSTGSGPSAPQPTSSPSASPPPQGTPSAGL
ncbi:MAG: hypothetical protein Q8R11_02580 [bacterium]|nr:hypothetical protein [bacterium]